MHDEQHGSENHGKTDHAHFVRRALELGRLGLGRTSPNPAVGAVIVRDGMIIGEGYHQQAGLPHAEIEAMRDATFRGHDPRGATLYCTLEPCCHTGRTGPCTAAIINAGIARVVVGAGDPNPLVNGKGIAALREAGIEVIEHILEDESAVLIAPFARHISTGMPYVTLKSAMSLDGKIATNAGESKWISSEQSREEVQHLRNESDAVMVGIGTALADDPRLTCRLPEGRNPLRIVVDSKASLSPSCRMLRESGKTIVATTAGADPQKVAALESAGAEVLVCSTKDGRVDLRDLLSRLGKRDVQSILVEGGSELAASFIEEGLADRLLLYVAPKIIGGAGKSPIGGKGISRMDQARIASKMSVRRIGEDLAIEVIL